MRQLNFTNLLVMELCTEFLHQVHGIIYYMEAESQLLESLDFLGVRDVILNRYLDIIM